MSIERIARQMAAATIEQSIKDIHSKHKTTEAKRNYENAKTWFNSKSTEPFSYYWCLDLTGLNANSIRKYLIEHNVMEEK